MLALATDSVEADIGSVGGKTAVDGTPAGGLEAGIGSVAGKPVGGAGAGAGADSGSAIGGR